jgi:hypothetical protein
MSPHKHTQHVRARNGVEDPQRILDEPGVV